MRKNRGFSVLEIMIAVGLMSVVGFGIMELMQRFAKQTAATNMKTTMVNQKMNLINTIQSDSAWEQTKFKNPQVFKCLADRTCTNQEDNSGKILTEQAFALYDAGGTLVADKGQGYSPSGSSCTFNASPQCPFQVTLYWHTICTTDASGKCTATPTEKVRSQVSYNPGAAALKANPPSPMNMANFEFSVIRGQSGNTVNLADACAMLQGTFDPGSSLCSLPVTGDCGPGYYMAGVDGNGDRICRELPSCPPKTIQRGYNADGTANCVAFTYNQLDNTGMLCPAGQVAQGISQSGKIVCATPATPPATPTPAPTPTCTGGIANGQTRTGTCKPPTVATHKGAPSYYGPIYGSTVEQCDASTNTYTVVSSNCMAWVWEYFDHTGCGSCNYRRPNQPACTPSYAGLKMKYTDPGTNNNDEVYRCKKYTP